MVFMNKVTFELSYEPLELRFKKKRNLFVKNLMQSPTVGFALKRNQSARTQGVPSTIPR